MTYESELRVESRIAPGVAYRVARISFDRRTALMKELREMARRCEHLGAGEDPEDRMDAAIIAAEMDRILARQALLGVEGLEIDGALATPESLAAAGPEDLFREGLAVVRAQLGLNDAERKN